MDAYLRQVWRYRAHGKRTNDGKGDIMQPLPTGKKITKCRICGGELIQVLDLDFHPPSDAFLTKEQLDQPEVTYPLRLCYCSDCTLAQLDYIVPRETLFLEDYPYETGVNEGGIKHFRDFADEILFKHGKYGIKNNFVVDIGGNDGTFLQRFEEHECRVLNVDPCGVKSKVPVWKGFWDQGSATAIKAQYGQADVITATNVLAHCEDLHDFMKGVEILLKDDGVFVIETPSLDAMIDGLQFDQIYHEHLGYFNPWPIEILLNQYGLGIKEYTYNEMHGGTLRIYCIKSEDCFHRCHWVDYFHRLKEFAERVQLLRLGIRSYVDAFRPVGIAASAKGNTLLNYCGLNNKDIQYITDKSLLKQGKYTPGSHIPIYADDKLIKDKPAAALMLACNFKKNIVKAVKEKGYKGRFIIPYPEVTIE
jgi:hypothetical protein